MINCLSSSGELKIGDFKIENRYFEFDAANTYRLIIGYKELKVELLPTKGFSLGQVYFNDRQIFWDQPIELPDPVIFSPYNDNVYINKKPARGFSFIPTYMGGVELYGMRNRGMPREENGFCHPVHGETSNIPVKETEVYLKQDGSLQLSASFIYREMYDDRAEWYNHGKEMNNSDLGGLESAEFFSMVDGVGQLAIGFINAAGEPQPYIIPEEGGRIEFIVIDLFVFINSIP